MPMAVFLQSASMPMVGRHYLNLTPHSQFVCPYFCFCLFSLCYSSPPVSSSPLSYFVIPLLVFGRTYLDSFFRRSCFSYCNSGFPKPGNIRQFKRMRTFRHNFGIFCTRLNFVSGTVKYFAGWARSVAWSLKEFCRRINCLVYCLWCR